MVKSLFAPQYFMALGAWSFVFPGQWSRVELWLLGVGRSQWSHMWRGSKLELGSGACSSPNIWRFPKMVIAQIFHFHRFVQYTVWTIHFWVHPVWETPILGLWSTCLILTHPAPLRKGKRRLGLSEKHDLSPPHLIRLWLLTHCHMCHDQKKKWPASEASKKKGHGLLPNWEKSYAHSLKTLIGGTMVICCRLVWKWAIPISSGLGNIYGNASCYPSLGRGMLDQCWPVLRKVRSNLVLTRIVVPVLCKNLVLPEWQDGSSFHHSSIVVVPCPGPGVSSTWSCAWRRMGTSIAIATNAAWRNGDLLLMTTFYQNPPQHPGTSRPPFRFCICLLGWMRSRSKSDQDWTFGKVSSWSFPRSEQDSSSPVGSFQRRSRGLRTWFCKHTCKWSDDYTTIGLRSVAVIVWTSTLLQLQGSPG